MAFLTLLIVLVLIQWWGSGRPLQWDEWFFGLRALLDGIKNVRVRLGLSLLLPVLAVALISALLEPLLFGLLLLIFHVVVLMYSLGRGDFRQDLEHWLSAWRAGDFEKARARAGEMDALVMPENDDDAPLPLYRAVRQGVLYQGFERWFAVVFWFMLLGPAAALVYRLLYFCAFGSAKDEREQALARQILYYVEWLPARALALSFALTGDFGAAFKAWQQWLLEPVPAAPLLDAAARGALHSRDTDDGDWSSAPEILTIETASELEGARSLLSRSVVLWVLVLAVAQLF